MPTLLERTLTSMEVAEMVGKEHKDVLRDIRNIIRQLGESKVAQSYFINSFYRNSQNKDLPCFDVTKKGCELYGTRMNGAKGTQFAVEYIERFNQLEEHAKQTEPKLPKSPMEILSVTFDALKQTDEKLEKVDNRVTELEENVTIDPGDYGYLTRRINKAVFQELEIKRFSKHKQQVDLFYKDINKGIHEITGVKTRSKLKQKQFDAVDSFITNWKPSTATITLAEQIELTEEE